MGHDFLILVKLEKQIVLATMVLSEKKNIFFPFFLMAPANNGMPPVIAMTGCGKIAL